MMNKIFDNFPAVLVTVLVFFMIFVIMSAFFVGQKDEKKIIKWYIPKIKTCLQQGDTVSALFYQNELKMRLSTYEFNKQMTTSSVEVEESNY